MWCRTDLYIILYCLHMVLFPLAATLCEVGPRDGFQFEQKPIPTDLKVEVIGMLVEAGIGRVQAASFVHPERVPQMADAEEVCQRLPQREGVIYSGLVLNRKGVERAYAAGLQAVDVSIALNEQHARANTNMSVTEAAIQAEEMIRAAQGYGMQAQMGLQTVFGYKEPGDTPLEQIVEISKRFMDLGIESLSLADSTGMANPVMIRRRVAAVREVAGNVPIVLHLHDTRGLGLANVYAALEMGVDRFDTSLGGLGGCPFIPGATGNIATEDTVYLLESMGVSTGIDWKQVAAVSRRMEEFLGRPLSGKMHRLV
jgi:hydroxymethylglutaryl-CoA lyase